MQADLVQTIAAADAAAAEATIRTPGSTGEKYVPWYLLAAGREGERRTNVLVHMLTLLLMFLVFLGTFVVFCLLCYP